MRNRGTQYFVAFVALFAALAAVVFWGTWSSDVAPVMPDNPVWHPISYADQFAGWLRGWLVAPGFTPVGMFWGGALPEYGVQELKYVTGLFAASLGLVLFLRGRGLSRLAAYGAGLLLAFCGYWLTLFSAGHGGWFIIMASVVPAYAFMDRVACAGKVRDGIVLGACAGWGTYAQPDLYFLFMLFLAVYGVYACVRERRFPWQAGLAALALFLVTGAAGIRSAFTESLAGRDQQIADAKGSALAGGNGVGAANASEAEKKKADDEARWVFVTNWSMPPEDTLEFFIPRIHGDTSCPMTLQLARAAGKDIRPYTGRLGRPLNADRGNYRQHSLYVGWVTCLLALLALGALLGLGGLGRSGNPDGTGTIRKGDILFFALAAFVFWLFSMGRYCEPVYRLVYLMPFGDYLRAPVKWHHLTEFCLCILAAFGIDTLFGFLRGRGCGERIAWALVALLVVFGATDLARQGARFCAPIDLRIVTGRNAAADEIVRRGKGAVCDLVEGGQGLVAWSFMARGVGVTRDPAAKDVRFILAGTEQVARTSQLRDWLQARAQPVGTFALTQQGCRSAPPQASNVALYQVKDVPAPIEPPRPPIKGGDVVLTLLALAGSFTAVFALVRSLLPRSADAVSGHVG